MERLFNEACDPKQLSPLTLAFVGDAAFELFVRERLVCLANCPVKKLHQNAVAQVRCQAQAKFMELLMPILTEEEIAVFKRGRNAKSVTMAKHATMIDYRMATGFEALMGYLYLTEQFDRLVELAGYGLEKIGEFETE